MGQEDPLKKGMSNYSSILAWEMGRAEEPGGLQSMGLQRLTMPAPVQSVYVCVYVYMKW